MSFFNKTADFNQCPVKSVAFESRTANNRPTVEAILHCPRLGDDELSESVNPLTHIEVTQRGAYKELAKTASSTLCNSCPFAGKTEPEIHELRLQTAVAKIRVTQAEAIVEQMEKSRAEGTDYVLQDPQQWQKAIEQMPNVVDIHSHQLPPVDNQPQ